jgi:hypothetical protein
MAGATLALGLWFTTTSAVAITKAAPASAPTLSTPASPHQTNLTPAVPVTSMAPPQAEEDIRDIRQPRHLPTPWSWVAAAVGVISLIAFALWQWTRRNHHRALRPHELALQSLAEARRLMDPDHAREYCFEASQIIRRYIEAQFRVRAPRLTTEEFLRDLVEERATMLAEQRELLGDFLRHCDLAKFAGWCYATPDLETMHTSAEQFVKQSAAQFALAEEEKHAQTEPPAAPISETAGIA